MHSYDYAPDEAPMHASDGPGFSKSSFFREAGNLKSFGLPKTGDPFFTEKFSFGSPELAGEIIYVSGLVKGGLNSLAWILKRVFEGSAEIDPPTNGETHFRKINFPARRQETRVKSFRCGTGQRPSNTALPGFVKLFLQLHWETIPTHRRGSITPQRGTWRGVRTPPPNILVY